MWLRFGPGIYARRNEKKSFSPLSSSASLLVVEVDDEVQRARRDVAANAVFGSQVAGVGIDDVGEPGSNGGADVLGGCIADLQALDGQASILSLDGRNVEARPAVVAGVTKVELTPDRGPATLGILGEALARSSTESTLGVLIAGDILGLTGLDLEGQGRVAVPAIQLAIGADLVPESHGPRLVDRIAEELQRVLVVLDLILGDLDDVAAPRVADVADVVDAGAGGRGTSTKAGGSAGRRRGSRRGSRGGRALSRSRGSGGDLSGGGRNSRPLVDPRDDLAVDGGRDDVTDSALLDVALVVLVAALVAVEARNSATCREGREEDKRVLQLHGGGGGGGVLEVLLSRNPGTARVDNERGESRSDSEQRAHKGTRE